MWCIGGVANGSGERGTDYRLYTIPSLLHVPPLLLRLLHRPPRYVGGMACCHNGGFLLDAEQEVPAFVDEVFFRFRFYYEDYAPIASTVVTTGATTTGATTTGATTTVVTTGATTTGATTGGKHQDINHVEWASNGCDSGCGGGHCPNECGHIEFDVVKGVGSKDGGTDVQVFQTTFKAGHMLAASCKMTDGQCMDGRMVGDDGFKMIMVREREW